MAHSTPSLGTSFRFCFCFTFLVILTSSITYARPRGLAVKLIHPYSVDSPYYNPNDTIADRARRDTIASMARVAYLEASTSSSKTDDTRAGVLPENNALAFMANISIGEPPTPQLVIIDTGSDLLWIQCSPCKCFQQKVPIFDPAQSSSYSNLPCSSPVCGLNGTQERALSDRTQKCDRQRDCVYFVKYVDGSFAGGNLANETLTFETSDEGLVTVTNIVFGCGHNNKLFNGQHSGVLGLGPESLSLVSQLGSRFSYCLGNIRDPNYSHNHIIFGDGAILQGDSTPLEVYNGRYYLSLESITIGEEKLNIDPAIFIRMPSGDGGVTLDSGATHSFLPPVAFDALRGEVQKLVGGKLTKVYDRYNPNFLCYKGTIDRDLTGFPTVVFNFAGGAQLALDTNGFFRMVGVEEFCMTVLLSQRRNKAIIGTYAQQFYNIGFDIPQKKVYMERIDCEVLEG